MSSKQSKKGFLLNSIIYTVSGMFLRCCSFFLLPLYTAYLTTEDYGIMGIANSFISTMSFVVAFSLFSAASRFYVEYKEDPHKLSRFYGSLVCFVFISGLVFGIVLTLFRDALSKYVFAGIDYYPIIMVCIISLTFNCQHTLYDNILRGQQRAMKSSVLAICTFFLTLILNIIFVVILRMGALGSLLAPLVAYIVYTIYFLIDTAIHKEIKLCIDWPILRDALKYSIPIMPHNLSSYIAALISQVLIGTTGTLSTLGIYNIAVQFGQIADTIQVYINNAYGPWLYEKLHDKDEEYKHSINSTVKMFSDIIGLFLIGLALFSQDCIILFIDRAYLNAWKYIPYILMVFAIKIAYYFYVNILFYYKEASRKLFIATLSGSLLNVLLSYIFIPQMGVYGSILADAAAMVVRVGIIIKISRTFEDTGIRLRVFFVNFLKIAVFVFGGLVLSYLKFNDDFSFVNFCYKVIFVIGYIIITIFQDKEEFSGLKTVFIKKKRG